MLKHWSKLLNTDCVVIGVSGRIIYPIFRVGYSSLTSIADAQYKNHEISKHDHIDILLRNPEQRFISGVNKYCQLNNLEVVKTAQMIRDGKIIDRHFMPQFVWLLHLHKYHKGTVTLRDFDHIRQITKIDLHSEWRKVNEKEKIPVAPPENFIDVDLMLMKHIGKTVVLEKIIKEHMHALS